jgi:hypothetical protein
VRPAVTYSGTEITVFDAALVQGDNYWVTFIPVSGASQSILATAVLRRDLADAVYRNQLALNLPVLPLGPTSITVKTENGATPFLVLPDSAFTVAPQPVTVPTGVGDYSFYGYRAAVSRDNVVYMSLNFEDIQDARVFEAQGLGYPLRFTKDDAAFYNRQGFLMQLLDESIPGLSALMAGGPNDSDRLHYSRHEFNTYFLQHAERQVHDVDPTDGNWHLDSTPHIDHDRQILELAGVMEDGTDPIPGATPPFTLVVSTRTLFDHGLLGVDSVDIGVGSLVTSYDSTTGQPGDQGDVRSNGPIDLESSVVAGDATALQVTLINSQVTGQITETTDSVDPLEVEIPSALPDLGSVFVGPGGLTIPTGSYLLADLTVINGTLTIDNANGPVTLYVNGPIDIAGSAVIAVSDPDPEQFAVYSFASTIDLHDGGTFYGVVYAPDSVLTIRQNGTFYGAFVGGTVIAQEQASVHYDSALSYEPCPVKPTPLGGLSEFSIYPGEVIDIGATQLEPDEMILVNGQLLAGAMVLGGVNFTVPLNAPVGLDFEVAI